jgi:hypothetical protein
MDQMPVKGCNPSRSDAAGSQAGGDISVGCGENHLRGLQGCRIGYPTAGVLNNRNVEFPAKGAELLTAPMDDHETTTTLNQPPDLPGERESLSFLFQNLTA